MLAAIELGEHGAKAKLRRAQDALGKAQAAARKAQEQLDTQNEAIVILESHLLRMRSKDLQDLRLGCAQRLLENQTQFGTLMVAILQVVNNAKVVSAGILRAESELARLYPEKTLNRLNLGPITELDFGPDHRLSHERADSIRERIRAVAVEPFDGSASAATAQELKSEHLRPRVSQPNLPLSL